MAGCSSKSATQSSVDEETVDLVEGETLSSLFQDSELPGMKGVVESERLRLFIEEATGVVVIQDKQNDQYYYTNPMNREDDSIATGVNKDVLSSQLRVTYMNQFGQSSTMNSYTDSIVHEQISFEIIDDGVRVNYKFGSNKKSADDLPLMLSVERYEALTGQMDAQGLRALTLTYQLNKENNVYERLDGSLKGIQLDRALQAFESVGYTEEDLMKDAAENNVVQEKAGSRLFLASIEYKLEDGDLLVRIPRDSIYYPDDYPIHTISLLSFFGAADSEEDGSIFVPDGSGALIHFNNEKFNYPSYEQQVYGMDGALASSESEKYENDIRLPVFGMMYTDSAFLGIIEEGAAAASINADVSGRLNNYNFVFPSFSVVNKDQVTLDANDQRRSLPKFQKESMKTDYVVRYQFLTEEQSSYSDLAMVYQQYLISKNVLPSESKPEETTGFYLDLIGGTTLEKHMLGVPYRALESLTTFDQAKEIVNSLKEKEIDNITLKYSGWFNGGLMQQVPKKVRVDSPIGGKTGLTDFMKFAEEQSILFYPEVAFTQVQSDKGLNIRKEVARTLKETPATMYPMDLSTNKRDKTKEPKYLLTPKFTTEYVNAFINGSKSFNFTGIALNDLASDLHSDFNKKNLIDRTEAEKEVIQSIEKIAENGYEMISDHANVYALPYLTNITNIPMSNSAFKIEDESIPFYQMVISGYIDYAGEPFNLSNYRDSRHYLLKTLEYGAGIHFKWMYEPNHLLNETDNNNLYSVNYQVWLEDAIRIYHEANDVYQEVKGASIVQHEKIGDQIYKSTYDNGKYIIVNYNNKPVTIDGRSIEAEGYIVGG